MKMTIDEHIEVLKSYSHGFTGYAGNLQNSINVAIDTMRKYQKIEQIIHDDWIKGVNSGATLNKIEEVLEDGRT